jgi:hypothetical protein
MQISTEFFETMYAHCEGRLELRGFASKLPNRRQFFMISQLDFIKDFCSRNRHYNLFFGVGTRDDTGNGGKNNVIEVPALWTDVDFKDTSPQEVKKNLQRFPFRPSIAVLTGHGAHFYWLLEEPATADDFDAVEDTLRRICSAMAADPAACEVARVLRIPGTVNVKKEPVPVKVHWLEDFHYNLEDFDILPEVKTENKHSQASIGNAPGWMVQAFKGIPEGGNENFPGRNVAATKIAGYFIHKLGRKDIRYLLQCQNIHNTPPLTKSDIEKIILSVSKYRRGENGTSNESEFGITVHVE